MSVAVRVWARVRGEYTTTATASAVAAVQALALSMVQLGLFYADPNWMGRKLALLDGLVAGASLIVSAMLFHTALLFLRVERTSRWMLPIYVVVALLVVLYLAGDGYAQPQVFPWEVRVLGGEVYQLRMTHTWIGYLHVAAAPLLCLLAYGVCGVTYLKGEPGGLSVFVGSGVVLLTVSNDALMRLQVIHGVMMLPVGLMFFGVMMTLEFISRYWAVARDYKVLKSALNERDYQLKKARRLLLHVQNELGRSQQLAAVGEMAGVVAHEVRNPLAIMSNAVSSLHRGELPPEHYGTLLGILKEETDRLNRLVTDLLTYARPVRLQRQRVVLHELSQCATLVNAHHEATIIYEATNVKGQIWADENLLRQVFDNLIDNAVQATDGTGKVKIALAPMKRDGVDGFVVTVTDDGEGMDVEMRSRAKDPFYTTRPAGTGLGLAIVTRIVEAHRGDIWFENMAEGGTKVNVFLPIGTETDPADSSPFSSSPASSESGRAGAAVPVSSSRC